MKKSHGAVRVRDSRQTNAFRQHVLWRPVLGSLRAHFIKALHRWKGRSGLEDKIQPSASDV